MLVVIEKVYLKTVGVKMVEGRINYQLWQFYQAIGVGGALILILNVEDTMFYIVEVLLFVMVVAFSLYKMKKGWTKRY